MDNFLNGRVLVYDMDTLQLKRGWGALRKPLNEISTNTDRKYDPSAPPDKDFSGTSRLESRTMGWFTWPTGAPIESRWSPSRANS